MSQQALKLSIPMVPPSVNHYVKHTRKGRHYQTKEALAFKATVWSCFGQTNPGWTKGVVGNRTRYHVHIKIMLAAKQRLDIDNGLKVTLDALAEAGVIHSDAAVTALSVSMGRDAANPRTEIEVCIL